MIPTSRADAHDARLPHLPALDGLRGVAVIAVLLFHSEFSWAQGGHLGVTTFFVLSGFLITSLLLVEHAREGRISLAAFWGRRARRLVPAALLAVALGGLYVRFGADSATVSDGVFADGVAALAWVANWRFIFDGQSYGDLFSEPSPFQHFWSLAIEEQFYVVLPLVVVGVLFFTSSSRTARWTLGGIFGVAVVASTEWVSLLHSPGDAPIRAYYGTDARLAEPALGALLAVLLSTGGTIRALRPTATRALDVCAALAAVALAVLMTQLSVYDNALYDGGLLLAAMLAAVVIAAATQGGLTASVLSASPLTSLGRISYGVYLFHWPIFLWLDEAATGLTGAHLLVTRSAITITLALVSYAVVEHPIRIGRLDPRVGGLSWANGAVAVIAGLAILTGTVTWPALSPTAQAVEVASGVAPSVDDPGRAARSPAPTPTTVPRPHAAAATTAEAAPATAHPPSPTADARSSTDASRTRAQHEPAQPAATASRYRVAFIGDSVAQNLAQGMVRWGRANEITTLDLTAPACPISRGGDRRWAENRPWAIPEECDWWDNPYSERWLALRRFAPDVIVVHDGLNELPDRRLKEWPKWMRPGEPVFDAWLTSEYRALIDAVAEQNIGLLLLNVPCAAWERHAEAKHISDPDGRVRALNTTVYHEIGTTATKVVDLFAYLCPDGEYSDTVDGIDDARPDGFHLSDRAAERAAERLLAAPIRELVDGRRAAGAPTP